MEGRFSTSVQKTYEYFAFISYSRKDEKWAKRLQQELEKYRLPMTLYKETESLPKNIRPVFRDVTDLSAGQLQIELHRQLDDSQKLIVICSPQSAQSEWVNKEISHFIDKRGYENVIPLIVDGNPNGGANECFPESLRLPEDEQLLGISVKELGWRDAFLRVVSGLLNVKFDSLKKRHEQRRKKRRMITAAMSLLLLVLSVFAGYSAWDYYVPHEAYYVDYALRQGVPEGIGPLSEQELSGRSEHYIIVTEKRRVIRLTHANSAGIPIPHAHTERLNRPMIAQYSYGDDGTVRTVEYMDGNGKVLLAENYTPDLKAVDFVASGDNSIFQTLASSTTSMSAGMLGLNAISTSIASTKSDITRHTFEYDGNGFVTKIIYMRDNRQTAVLDSEGIGGLEYKLDEYGRPVEVRYLGLRGDGYAVTRMNVAGKRYTYDNAHNLIREEYIDPNGAPVLNEQGWMISTIEYDTNGNAVKQSCFDANGNLLPSGDGYAVVEQEFDHCGNRIKESYLGADGGSIINNYGFATVNAEYDERGNCTLWAAYGVDGQPALTIYGHSSMKMEYDERNNMILESYLGADGQPVLLNDSYSTVKLSYDEHGNVIKATYLGIDGRLILNDEGYAVLEREYDNRGNIIRTSCFGADEQPILNSYGYASVKMEYDEERGNLIKIFFLGADGQPVLSNDGLATMAMDYDEYGNLIKISFLGTDGGLVLSSKGCAGFAWGYDNFGNMIKEANFGVDGQPILNNYGYSSLDMQYDERGNLIKEFFLGADGLPALSAYGYSSSVMEYDEHDKLIKESFFDPDGKPVILD